MKQKYIKIKSGKIILFPQGIDFSIFEPLNPISAGYADINWEKKKVKTYGAPYILDVGAHKEDSAIIKQQLWGIK